MRYLDHNETAVLRTARQGWTCTGHTHSEMTHGPIHWLPGRRAPNMVGAYPVNAMWTEHADGCPIALPAGTDYVEDLSDVPPFQSGPRYSIVCAARYVFGETVAETRARIARTERPTRGPWINANGTIRDKKGRAIAALALSTVRVGRMPADEMTANARLIVAAPDLLGALQAWAGCQHGVGDCRCAAVARAVLENHEFATTERGAQ